MSEQLSEEHRALIERVLPGNTSVSNFIGFRCGFDDLESLLREAYQQGWNDREGDLLVNVDRVYPARPEGPHPDHVPRAEKMVPHPESGEWVMVPRQPSYKLVSDLATEWGYSIEEASESYQGFLDVVSRHGAAGSDPEAYEADRLADEGGEAPPPPLEGAGAEPVAWSLVFYEGLGINAPTTFKTLPMAESYLSQCADPKPRVVPLYARPSPGVSREEVARIISPLDWCARDTMSAEDFKFSGLCTERSLEKADAILSLLSRGEG